MELRNYVQILRKNWWLILPLTLIALTVSLVVSYSQPRVYQSTASFISTLDTPTSSINDTIYGLDTLTQRTGIFVTYCEVMTSQSIRTAAYQLVGLDPLAPELAQYQVLCNVLPSANVVILVVQGPSPVLAQRLNEAISIAGTSKANSLYRYFGLQQLDQPIVKEASSSSNRLQTGLLGGILGLAVSVSLAFGREYLLSPQQRMELLVIRDPKLGVYNERYFRQRLTEEINRARSRHRPISMALVRLVPSEDFSLVPESAQEMLLRSAALWMGDSIRQGDILAALGRSTLAILLQETPGDEAHSIISRLHSELRAQTFGTADFETNFSAITGIVESSGGILDLRAMLTKASEALQTAEQSGEENAIELVRTSPRPFALDAAAGPQISSPFGEMELDEAPITYPNEELFEGSQVVDVEVNADPVDSPQVIEPETETDAVGKSAIILDDFTGASGSGPFVLDDDTAYAGAESTAESDADKPQDLPPTAEDTNATS